MKLTTLLGATALTMTPMFGMIANAESHGMAECENCAESMVLMSWGGAYQASQLAAYAEPYAAATGVTITWDEGANESIAKMRAASEAGNMTYDLVDIEGPDSQRACDEGLAVEIDFDTALAAGADGSTPTADFGPSLINDCFVPQIVFSTTFGYRTDVAAWNGAVPDSMCAIFDTDTFPGMRTLESRPKKNLEWALLCDGVAQADLYTVLSEEGGVERALAKLDTIRDSVIWWGSAAEAIQYLADGEAVIGSAYNGRFFSAIVEQDQPLAMLWDWQVFDFDGWVVPAGLDEARTNRAMHFLKFATDTQRLADQALYISYGPARASSQPLVGTHVTLGIDMAQHMPTNPANQTNFLVNNIEWWADNSDEVDAKFQAWLAQ